MNNTHFPEIFSTAPEFFSRLVAWAKADMADWHSRSFFNIFGWVVDKADLMALIVAIVVFGFFAFFVVVGLIDPDKLDEPRRRPGMD